MSKKKDLKTQVEQQLSDMLESGEEPSEGRMKLLKLGMTMLAINAKLEENDFGGFFRDDEPGGVSQQPEGKKPSSRRRTNGDGTPDA
jgi:hypothetical protein